MPSNDSCAPGKGNFAHAILRASALPPFANCAKDGGTHTSFDWFKGVPPAQSERIAWTSTLTPSCSPVRLLTAAKHRRCRYPSRNASLSGGYSGFYAEKLDECIGNATALSQCVDVQSPQKIDRNWAFGIPKDEGVIERPCFRHFPTTIATMSRQFQRGTE